MSQNKTWKTVYIRVADYDKILPSGNPQYKWVAIGKMYGWPRHPKVELDE